MRWYSIAMIYPLILFVISWTFGGATTIGTVEALPVVENGWVRLGSFGLAVLYGMGIFCLLRNERRVQSWIDDRLARIENKALKKLPERIITGVAIGLLASLVGFVIHLISGRWYSDDRIEAKVEVQAALCAPERYSFLKKNARSK